MFYSQYYAGMKSMTVGWNYKMISRFLVWRKDYTGNSIIAVHIVMAACLQMTISLIG